MATNKIRALDPIVIDQIAAGEVVSRPSSVAKELIENSLDAGALNISIDVVGGGIVSLIITDDGNGIVPEEMALALTRHATSKLIDISDLETLHTLGFRGEALASISSVSRLKLTSKYKGSTDPLAYCLECQGGQLSELKKTARNPGTTIEVLDLFYNVPARRKFLKKEITEFGHIADTVEKFIFSFPQVRFTLTHNGKKIYTSPGNGLFLDAISCLWPRDITSGLIEINYAGGQVGIRGYVGGLTVSRSDKSMQVFFVNQRSVYNSTLVKALDDAYRNLLENHRHPVCVLFIDIDPAVVDVNVHPAKKEIKFHDTSLVYNAVKNAVINTLRFTEVTAQPVTIDVPEINSPVISTQPHQPRNLSVLNSASSYNVAPQASFNFNNLERKPAIAQSSAAMQALAPTPVFTVPAVKQIMETYLVQEQDGSMVIYDQHALHERILFEKLKSAETSIASQRLLVPEMVFLSKAEMIRLEEYKDIFASIGFEIEFFGADCVLLRALPTFMKSSQCVEMFTGIMADIMEVRHSDAVQKIREDVYKIIACRGAIKAGDKLSAPEIENLLKNIPDTPNIQTCPHGRPTAISFTRKDLDKLFHRI